MIGVVFSVSNSKLFKGIQEVGTLKQVELTHWHKCNRHYKQKSREPHCHLTNELVSLNGRIKVVICERAYVFL